MIERRILLFLNGLLFFIPLNIYVIGDWMGSGIQWALIRYQNSPWGHSFIPVTKDIGYILEGIISGKSAVSSVIWDLGIICLLVSFILLLIAQQLFSDRKIQSAGIIILTSGSLFLISDVIQYGPLFYGPSGFAIPVGLPLVFFTGILMYAQRYRKTVFSSLQYNEKQYNAKNDFKSLFYPIRRWIPDYSIMDIAALLIVTAVIFQIVFIVTISMHIDNLHYDTLLYYYYGDLALKGQMPYIDFPVEYPQLFFAPVAIALIPTLFSQKYWGFYTVFVSLMMLLNIGLLLMVYRTAQKMFNRERAFLCGLLYATAFSSAFFTFVTYDIYPAFLAFLSFSLFIFRKEIPAWIAATLGGLAKWFSFLLLPVYLINQVKNETDKKTILREILISSGIVLLVSIPFLLVNPDIFLRSYTFHVNRSPQPISMIFYLDTYCQYLFGMDVFSKISLLLLVIAELVLFLWYYRRGMKDNLTLLHVAFFSIFIFIIFNKVLSPQYLVWLTPFLAIILSNTIREIILFYIIQIVFFFEHPLLFKIVFFPNSTYSIFENGVISFPFVFFTVKFLILMIAFFVIANNLREMTSLNQFQK